MIIIAQEQWNELIKKDYQFREEYLLDFHSTELLNKSNNNKRIYKQVIERMKKEMQWNHAF